MISPAASRSITLRCTVRDCAQALEEDEDGARCANGHSFDRARAGYLNLLQPQDRRSHIAGDSPDTVDARRRLAAEGTLDPIYSPLLSYADAGARILDCGCGEGSFLRMMGPRVARLGADLSIRAVERAAREDSSAQWVVANLDRAIPVVDGTLDVIYSIAARRNFAEFARVLAPGGRVVIAVPGPDDLVELREHIGGERVSESRIPRIERELGNAWIIDTHELVSHRIEAGVATVRDLLQASYRGQRRSTPQFRNEPVTVTLSFDVLVVRPLERMVRIGGDA